MENNPAIHTISQANIGFTPENVTQKFNIEVPQAFNFGAQVGIFVLATLLAITFLQFLLNRD